MDEALCGTGPSGNDGATPVAGLTYHEGYFYGTTAGGGVSSAGTVFRIDPTTGKETVLYSFADGVDVMKSLPICRLRLSGLFEGHERPEVRTSGELPSAIHDKACACDVTRVVTGEEKSGSGDLFRARGSP